MQRLLVGLLFILIALNAELLSAQTEIFSAPNVFKECDDGVQPLPFLYTIPTGEVVFGCNNKIYSADGTEIISETRSHFNLQFTSQFGFKTDAFRPVDEILRVETYSYPFGKPAILLNRADHITPGVVPMASFKVGERYVFEGGNGDGTQSIFTTNGTTEGTKVLLNARIISALVRLPARALFSATKDGVTYMVYTDGTEKNTALLKADECRVYSGFESEADGAIYFLCQRRLPEDPLGEKYELWRTDGTPEATKQINIVNNIDVRLHEIVGEINGTIIYIYSRPDSSASGRSYHLALSDAKGAYAEIFMSPEPFRMSGPTHQTSKLLFSTFIFLDSEPQRSEVWSTDGTIDGSRKLYSSANMPNPLSVSLVGIVGRYVFFSGIDLEHGEELWQTDGTIENTKLFADMIAGPEGSDAGFINQSGSRIYFRARLNEKKSAIYSFDVCLTCVEDPNDKDDPNGDIGLLSAPGKLKVKKKKGKYQFTMEDGGSGAEYELILKRKLKPRGGIERFSTKRILSKSNQVTPKKIAFGKWVGLYRIRYGKEIYQITRYSRPKNFKVKKSA